jgi:hypothetical protein
MALGALGDKIVGAVDSTAEKFASLMGDTSGEVMVMVREGGHGSWQRSKHRCLGAEGAIVKRMLLVRKAQASDVTSGWFGGGT